MACAMVRQAGSQDYSDVRTLTEKRENTVQTGVETMKQLGLACNLALLLILTPLLGFITLQLLMQKLFFKPRAPPERRLAKAAYLSHHALVIIVTVVVYGIDRKTSPPPKWENMISHHFMQF